MKERQVFQTTSPGRWQRFKWSMRVVIAIVVVMLITVGIAIVKVYNPTVGDLGGKSEHMRAILNPQKELLLRQLKPITPLKELKGLLRNSRHPLQNIRYVHRADSLHRSVLPIRAAFYVAWDAQSYTSLRNNIGKLNMVLPEWLFLDPDGDSLNAEIDSKALNIIKSSGVKALPMLTNFIGNDFDGAVVHRIINNPQKSQKLIDNLISILTQNKFHGINIDFEELQESTDENLVRFMKSLYEQLHAKGFLVTQDISPFNSDYNLTELNKYNDYMFIMAYDEHNSDSDPGDISSKLWVDKILQNALEDVPPQKLVLCIAGYGYDWSNSGKGKDITYQEALSIAAESDAKPKYDKTSTNLSYGYYDDDDSQHYVFFTDAATNFNSLRQAANADLAGVSLWRLGSEDSRIWRFYNHAMSDSGIAKFPIQQLTDVPATNNIDYEGEGDILDVAGTPKPGIIHITPAADNTSILDELYQKLPSTFVVHKYGHADKKLVLSFDDGPDEDYTPRILDILSREHVPAAFFMLGMNAEANIPIVKRVYREGHEIGSHTFTHPNMALVSEDRAILELNATRLLLESITGHSTIMFRPPYNADAEPETMEEMLPVSFARKYNYITIGESIDPNDWEKGVSADSIFARVVAQQHNGNIILLHDAGGNREATIAALPRIIEYFKKEGYTFTNIAGLLHETRNDLMPAVPHTRAYYLMQTNYYIALLGYYLGHFLFALFVTCIILSLVRIAGLYLLTIKQRRREKKALILQQQFPFVSVIIPAYNEAINAVKTIENICQTTYPNFEVIFVNDGSTDNTFQIVKNAFSKNDKVRILTKNNGGKASALNVGIKNSSANILVCVDADTVLAPDAISLLVHHFSSSKIGAVAGNVKVGNKKNILTRWQFIEYITSQNFDRRAFSYVNAITVVPGAIGAFRKEAIEAAGNFTSDTLAEDCDLTIRILRAGFIIVNENRALAYTEAPETIHMFLKQRFRWTFGVMQTFWKNRDALCNSDYGSLGWIALPNILLFQILIPLISPIADFLMLIGILTGNAPKILFYYFLFMMVDVLVAFIAFSFERVSFKSLVWIIPQRLGYRWLMLFVLFKAFRRAIKGELQHWGVLQRTGAVHNPK
ncbi:MAG: glycosyltransferase [Bacteroidetes bacterium]|nr:glycosyltransferase [Bacteroidota bacterium]